MKQCRCHERMTATFKAWGLQLHSGLWYLEGKAFFPDGIAKRHTTCATIIAWGELRKKGRTRRELLLGMWRGLRKWWKDRNPEPRPKPEPINCAERIHVCKAACCHLYPVPSVAHGGAGYPCPMLTSDRKCSIHGRHPPTCKSYHCRYDSRIWLDFDNMIPNPQLEEMLHGD